MPTTPGFRATAMHAFLMIGPDGDEGVPAVHLGDVVYPLVAADEQRLRELRPLAQQVATQQGRPITLVRFDGRQEVETINP